MLFTPTFHALLKTSLQQKSTLIALLLNSLQQFDLNTWFSHASFPVANTLQKKLAGHQYKSQILWIVQNMTAIIASSKDDNGY